MKDDLLPSSSLKERNSKNKEQDEDDEDDDNNDIDLYFVRYHPTPEEIQKDFEEEIGKNNCKE